MMWVAGWQPHAHSRTLTHTHTHSPSGVVWVINLWNTLVRAAFFSSNVGRPLSEPSDSAMHTHPRREQEEEEEQEEARGVRGRGSERERETELHGNTQGHATETLEGIAPHRTAPVSIASQTETAEARDIHRAYSTEFVEQFIELADRKRALVLTHSTIKHRLDHSGKVSCTHT